MTQKSLLASGGSGGFKLLPDESTHGNPSLTRLFFEPSQKVFCKTDC